MLSQDITVNGARPSAAQCLDHQAEHRAGRAVAAQVGRDAGLVGDELAGDVVEVVAALGDGQADDPGVRVRHLLDDGVGGVDGEQVLDDAADDA
jgi:hypothetical protein